MMSPTLFFLLNIVLVTQDLLQFHTNFGLKKFCEKCHCNFDRDCIDSRMPWVEWTF